MNSKFKRQKSKMQIQNSKVDYKRDLVSRCYLFSLQILSLTDKLPNKRSSWVIADQLIRSATSIGANLVESKASSSRLEFKKFHEISLKSANETRYWLALLKDAKLTSEENVDPLIREVTEFCKMIASGIIKLKNK